MATAALIGAQRRALLLAAAPQRPPCHTSASRRRAAAPIAAAGDAAAGSAWGWRSPDWKALQGQVPPPKREAERSAMVNEEVVYFIFQLELDSQLQRALNYTAYEAAQQIRAKRETVDLAIRQMQERKGAAAADGGGGEGASAAMTSIDLAAEGLQLRSEMQRAVEDERYADAAKYRDLLAELEKRSKQAAAAASEWAGSRGRNLRLGQRVVHRGAGYRGVVVGWDSACCEDDEWVEQSGAVKLGGGLSQPFYHVLVDVRDWAFDAAQPPVAYVAQELLAAPELCDDGASWGEVYGSEELQHPYSYVLFLGADARGDLLPCRQLRDKYNQPRRDVYAPGAEEGEEGESGGEDGGNSGGGGGGGGGGGSGPKIPGIDMSSLM